MPVPSVEASPRALASSAAFFPLVGAALGLAVGGLGLALEAVLPRGPAVVLQLVALVVLTGGLHLDGLMDTADGVFGGRTRERRLEIMRDSRVGAFGVLAGVLAVLGQYACLVELPASARIVALALALVLGRWGMALALSAFPSARSDGLGVAYGATSSAWPAMAATAVASVGAVAAALWWAAIASATPAHWAPSPLLAVSEMPLLPPAESGWALALGGMALALAVALAGGRWLAGRLGGLTGDTYGALCVVVETLVLSLAVSLR